MDGIHDLGGMEGFGPIAIEDADEAFHADWEPRVMALRVLMGFWGKWNIDAGRHSVEQLPPADYLSLSYYEKWLASLVNLMTAAELVTIDEVKTGHAAPGVSKAAPPADSAAVAQFIPRGRPALRQIEAAPRFAVGDKVRTARHMHSGHNRLPRYTRGYVGEIARHHGAHVFPDTHAKLAGETPQHLYTVRFNARDLWGDEADARDTVNADLWESYLVPA